MMPGMEHPYRKAPGRNDLILALFTLPLYLAGIGRYGLRLALLLLISAAVGAGLELAAFKLRRRPVGLLSFPAWLILPLILPPVFPLWMAGLSLFFGLLIGVVFFGGQGRQLAAPVAIAWTFAALSFPSAFGFGWSLPFPGLGRGFSRYLASVLTIDHPLVYLQAKGPVPLLAILGGDFPQTPGNAVPLLVLICGLLLLLLRAVDVVSACSFLGTAALLQMSFHLGLPDHFASPAQLLVGNLLLASFFVFPDYRTASRTFSGRWLSGILAGCVAFLVRNFSSFPDGVFFAVLFGNSFAPIIDEGVLRLQHRRVDEKS